MLQIKIFGGVDFLSPPKSKFEYYKYNMNGIIKFWLEL